MSKRVLFSDAEIALTEDYNAIGETSQIALDAVEGDAIGYPAHWAGYTVSIASAQEVAVSAGRYHEGDIVYASAAPVTINLQTYFPLAASDEKWLALILRSEEIEVIAERSFRDYEIDPESGAVVQHPTPKYLERRANVIVQQGFAAPPPALKPTIAETDACICFVRVTTAGVQSLEAGEKWRVKSLHEVEGRVTALELQVGQLLVRAATLESDLANTNSRVDELYRMQVRPDVIRQLRRDVAALRIRGDVPEGARSDWYDPGLVYEQWDPTHAQWHARVDEGVHFPFASMRQTRLELLDEADPRVAFVGRRMVPAYDVVKRIYNEGTTATKLISQITHTEIEAIQRTVARSRISYGPTIDVCTNSDEWGSYLTSVQMGSTFAKNGEVFEVADNGHIRVGGAGHLRYNVRTVREETYYETYWEYNSITVGVNGSVYGQTFLVAQPMVCPSIELNFAQVGNDGDVHLFVCQTSETGAPLVNAVIAKCTKRAADLRLGWNVFEIDLSLFDAGQRLAWFTVTTGNHKLYGTINSAYTGGTSFQMTDGIWAQGDLLFDFAFRVNGCRFRSTRTVIEFQPMLLDGGMTEFRLLYPGWAPASTGLTWEVQPVFGGEDQPWYLAHRDATRGDPLRTALVGLPPMVRLRATFVATQDLAPMIEMSADAVYTTARVDDDFRCISDPIGGTFSTTAVQTYIVLDSWDAAAHTFSPRILAGTSSTLIAPDVSTTTPDPDKPGRIGVLSTYTVPAGTTTVRLAAGGQTNNIVNCFFVQNAALFLM